MRQLRARHPTDRATDSRPLLATRANYGDEVFAQASVHYHQDPSVRIHHGTRALHWPGAVAMVVVAIDP